MGAKKYLIPMLLLLILASANAAVTTTITSPAGQTFYPNLEGDKFMDINITVIDSVAGNAIHEVGIQFDSGDGNLWLTSDSNTEKYGTDENISILNCTFATDDVWSTPGAYCTFRYTFPTSTQLPTRGYVLDVNASAYTIEGEIATQTDTAIATFAIDNRYVSTSVEAMLAVISVVLIAAVIASAALAMLGIIEPRTVLFIAIGAVISVIAVIVMTAVIGILTP